MFSNIHSSPTCRIEGAEPEACFIEEALQYISERECGISVFESATDAAVGSMPSFEEELDDEQVAKLTGIEYYR
jgi:hypothetical protein